MNEQALNYSYELFKKDGYTGTLDQYRQLISSNKEALNYSYGLFKNDGYSGSVNDFSSLISPAVESPAATKPVVEQPKKKEDTVSPFVDGGSGLTKFDPRTGQVVQETPSFASVKPQAPQQPKPTETIMYGPMGATGLQRTKEYKPEFEGKSIPKVVGELGKTFAKGVVKFPADVLETAAIATAAARNLAAKTGLVDETSAIQVSLPIAGGGVNFFQAASEWKNLVNDFVPTDKDIESGFWGQTATALGQMVPVILTGGISGGGRAIAKEAGKKGLSMQAVANYGKDIVSRMGSAQGLVTVSQVAAPSYQQAKMEGATENEALGYALQNAVITFPLEMMPVNNLFKRLDNVLVGNKGVEVLKRALVGGVEEGVTEGIQNIYENVSADAIYGTTREFLDGVGEATAVGGTVGAIMNGLLTALLGRRARATSETEIEQLDKSIEEVQQKVSQVESNNKAIEKTITEIEEAKPRTLSYGSANYNFLESKNGELEYTDDALTEEQAQGVVNNLSSSYKKIDFTIEEVEPESPYQPTTYKIIGKPKTIQEDAIQKQAAGQVPVQPRTGISQEMAQGEPQAEPQVITQEGQEKVRPSISEMAGESVTVRIGNRNVSGIVEVDEGGKATITEGSVIYEIPSDSEFSEFSRPINITKDGDFVVNGDSFNEARIVLEDGKRKALLIRQDGTTKAVTNPRVVEEIEYNIALASLEEMNDADADNLINQYEQQRKTEKPTEGGIDKTISETDEDRKLREAFEEIDLIEEMALMELEDVESQAKLVEHTPKTMKEAKTYLVKKNPDGTYQATLNGRKVARKEVLDDLGKLFEQRASEDISKLQEQTNKLKQEVEEKLFGKEKVQAEPQEEVVSIIESAKNNLANRLSGDQLLDSQDLIDELNDNNAQIDEDGMVTVYHRTTPEKKAEIEKTGEMKGLEDGVFFSTTETGQSQGYGNAVVKLKIPVEQLTLDDTFGDEAHLRIPTAKAGQVVNVKEYLQIEPQVQEEVAPAIIAQPEVAPTIPTAPVVEAAVAAPVVEEVSPKPAKKETFEELMERSRKEGEAIEAETKDFNSRNEREYTGRKDKGIIQDDIIQAENDVFSAKKRISSADDVEAAVNEYNKAKEKVSELQEEINQIDNFNEVDNLISEEIEKSKKPNYEYRELFEKDPRLASIEGLNSLIDFLKTIDDKDDSISLYERFIKNLKEDIKKYPIKEQVSKPVAKAKKAPKKTVPKKDKRDEIISRPAVTPFSLARQWLLSGGKLRSIQSEEDKRRGVGVGKGVREETGMSGIEMRTLTGTINNKKGISIERAAEQIHGNLDEDLKEKISGQDIRNALIDILKSENKKTWIDNQDRETSEDSGSRLSEYYGYDQYEYDRLTDEERADFDAYYFPIDPEEQYFIENAERLAQEYDEFINSEEYQNYIEEIYGSDREGQGDVKDQGDTGSKKQGADGETDFVQAKEQVEENLDELLKLNPKEKGTGQRALDYLDGLLKDYDKIEKEGLGVNIALPVIKKIIQGVRALVKAGMTLSDAINKVAEDNNVSVEDVVNSIDQIDKQRKKAAPSVAKILGKPRKKITVDEMAALKDQIRLEARAARQAKGDLNNKRAALAARIIAARRNGAITSAQARTLVNRINRVNLDNPIMVDRLIQYTDKVFDNANYAADMVELRKLQKQARSKKHTSMKDFVDRFTSINPELIPLDRIQEYKKALDFLNNLTPSYATMNEILDEMLSYQVTEEFDAVKTLEALQNKYESIQLNEVGSVEEYVNLIKDINSFKRKAFQLLQNEEITQEQYDDLIKMVGKDQQTIEEDYKDEITKIKKDLIAEIKNQRPKVSRDFSNVENDLIRKYLELSDADLQSLSPEELFILNDLLENISNGEIDVSRFGPIVSKAYTSSGLDPLAKQINKSKFDKNSEEGRQALSEQESSFWEGLLGMGRAKVGALQKLIISPFNRAISSYEKLNREGYNEFLRLKNKYKIDKFDPLKNSKDMHKIGMLTTYLQEHMAQFDSKNKDVKDIGKRDWFKEILNSRAMRDNYSSGKPSVFKSIGLGKSELDIIKEIWDSLPKDKDGNVDPKAVYDSYMANDGKFFTKNQKAFFDDVMAYKAAEITPKQKFANELSGASFKEIPFHMMRVRLDKGKSQIAPTASSENNNVRISAGTGKERVSEKVGAVMTNFEKLFIKGLEQTGRDYFLSNALQDINNTLAGVKKIVGDSKIELINTISYTLSDALKFEFDRVKSNFIFRNLLSARAAQTLLRPIRTAVELGSTLISYPVRAKTLSGYKSLFGEQGAMKKLLEFTDSPMLLRNNISKAIDINDGSIEPQSAFTKATNYLSGLPERTMMVTSWMPTFKSEFKAITGIDFDMNKFNNSEAYIEKYGKAIRESAAAADAQTEKIIGPTTKAGQRREVRIAPKFLANLVGSEGTVSKNTAEGQILGFFSNYPFRESTEFLNGFREAAEVLNDEGALSSLSQLQKPLGVALNVAAYSFLSSATYALGLMLLGDDEDEKRGEDLLKSLLTGEGLLEELKSNAISLAGSQYAAGGKAIIQLAVTILIESTDDEKLKAKYKKLLKDSVFIDPLPVDKALGFKGEEEVAGAIGKYIPQFGVAYARLADLIGTKNEIKAIYDKVESKGVNALTEDEGLKILALNTLFNGTQIVLNLFGTSLPEYNNIKTYMKKLKQDAGVAEVYKGEAPAKKKSSGGGGGSRAKAINKSDLKKYFPEQYNELYGEGSATYEIEQEIKAFEKEQRELKKSIKDQVYGGQD
jgi:endonuclease III